MKFQQDQTAQKLRGGYYTPDELGFFLARWATRRGAARVLEPSCGDGALLRSLARVGEGFEVVGFELDSNEAKKARQRALESGLSNARVHASDFLEWAIRNFGNTRERFDAVVGNPPFIRYQYLPEEFQSRAAKVFALLGLPFTKHTNAWVPFVLASIQLLKPGGRLAMVVPAELIHVMHAQALRTYLGLECSRLVVIDPEELWFGDTMQGAIILLAEKKASEISHGEGVGIYRVKAREFATRDPEEVFAAPEAINGKTVEGKWTRALLHPRVRGLLDEMETLSDIHRFHEVAEVDVGIVTGANKFFLVPDATVDEFELEAWAHPMFGRSEHCPGVIYDLKQHRRNAADGNPTNFLWFDENQARISPSARRYIKGGERESLHLRYKCRNRTPWYKVPSVHATPIGMLKRSHDTPRLILNKLGALTTDTAYRVQSKGIRPSRLVGCFLNPLTAISAELEGRHYGGGVLELVPSEIERLLVPVPKKASVNLPLLDKAIRGGPVESVLAAQGRVILSSVGVSNQDQDELLAGWKGLRDRRQRIESD